jgi:ribonucleoside-diphosphate reductase alpha chain
MGKTSAEKSTGRGGELNAVPVIGGVATMPKAEANLGTAPDAKQNDTAPELGGEGKFCSLDEIMNGSCEACQ